MHALPPLSVAPPHALTIVAPDAEHDPRAIPYQHILALAQVVKEEQLAAGLANYVGRDSLNSTPDMYEHPSHRDAYIHNLPGHPILNTPLSPLSSASIHHHHHHGQDARVPSLSPSPIDEHIPEHAAVQYLSTPLLAAQPRSAPHDQFHFTNPFLPGSTLPSGLVGHSISDRYVFPPDRRMSEPTPASHAHATVESAPVFLSATGRLASHNARVKSLATASPAPSSPANVPALWTPPLALKPDPETHHHHHHGTAYGLPGSYSAGAAAFHANAGRAAEPEPVSPLHSTPTYSASGSEPGQNAPRPDARPLEHSRDSAYLSSSQPTPVAPYSLETAHATASASTSDVPFTPPMGHAREDPSSPDQSSSKTYSFVPLPGNAVKKRPRRRYDEIERLYRCKYVFPSGEECSKAYGTLNHLNAHIQMQRHGEKRSPTEFKELRKQWRKAKKDAELMAVSHPRDERAVMPSGSSPRSGRPHLGLRIPSDFGHEVVQSPTHLVSPSPIGPPSFGFAVGGAGYMHEPHAVPRGAGAGYAMPPSAYPLPALSSLHAPGPMAHDERVGHDWASPTPTQASARYRYADDRRLSLPGRPPLSNRSSWASDYGYEYDGSAQQQQQQQQTQPPPPQAAAQSPAQANYVPATHFGYGADGSYHQGAGYMPQQSAHGQELPPPTQEELERFPPTNTLLTPLPGYVPPPLELGPLDLPPPTYHAHRPATSSATTLLAPIPALTHGGWRREELEQHDARYHGGRQQ